MTFDISKREKRVRAILGMLVMHQHLTIPELCRELNFSESTVRNDLREMERRGMVKRVYGGVISTGNTTFSAGMTARYPAFQKEKIAIGRHVLERYLAPGATIFLDAGTTALELARLIADLPFRVNVLTNSLNAAHAISANERHVLHLAGGCLDPMVGSFHDHNASVYLDSVHADIFFFCPASVSLDAGFASPDHSEADLKRIMIHKARRVVALADHSKLGKTSFYSVCGLAQVEALITDDGADPDLTAAMEKAGCPCVAVPVGREVAEG